MKNKILKVAALLFVIIGIIVVAGFWYLREQGNFHPVTPGEAYRSAQMDRDELTYYLHKYKIRSVINLRGKNPGYSWYREELSTCRHLGVRHYNLGLSAEHRPSLTDIRKLLIIFKTAPRPVLIHCESGADRSGLVAALWKIVVDGTPKSVAQKQLSLRFGHLPFGPTQAMDRFLSQWVTPITTEFDSAKANYKQHP
jgi:protein tyrosine/serine phosphatase